MTLKRLKEVIKEMFRSVEQTDEHEEAILQMLSLIEEEEEYRRKVRDMLGGARR